MYASKLGKGLTAPLACCCNREREEDTATAEIVTRPLLCNLQDAVWDRQIDCYLEEEGRLDTYPLRNDTRDYSLSRRSISKSECKAIAFGSLLIVEVWITIGSVVGCWLERSTGGNKGNKGETADFAVTTSVRSERASQTLGKSAF